MQEVTWNEKHYIFGYEQETASETCPDYREVIICQMAVRIDELKKCIGDLMEKNMNDVLVDPLVRCGGSYKKGGSNART